MKVIIPTAMRKYTGGESPINVDASTVDEALSRVVSAHPDLRESLYDDSNNLVSFVNVFVNDRNIRDLEEGATKLNATDEILLVPAIAGG